MEFQERLESSGISKDLSLNTNGGPGSSSTSSVQTSSAFASSSSTCNTTVKSASNGHLTNYNKRRSESTDDVVQNNEKRNSASDYTDAEVNQNEESCKSDNFEESKAEFKDSHNAQNQEHSITISENRLSQISNESEDALSPADSSSETLVPGVSEEFLYNVNETEKDIDFDHENCAVIEYPQDRQSKTEEDLRSLDGIADLSYGNISFTSVSDEEVLNERFNRLVQSEESQGEETETDEGILEVFIPKDQTCRIQEENINRISTIKEECDDEEEIIVIVSKGTLDTSTMGSFYSSTSRADTGSPPPSGSLLSSPRSSAEWRVSMASTATVTSTETANSEETLANDMSELSSINSQLSYFNEDHKNHKTDSLVLIQETESTQKITRKHKTSIKDAIDELESIEHAATALLLKKPSVSEDDSMKLFLENEAALIANESECDYDDSVNINDIRLSQKAADNNKDLTNEVKVSNPNPFEEENDSNNPFNDLITNTENKIESKSKMTVESESERTTNTNTSSSIVTVIENVNADEEYSQQSLLNDTTITKIQSNRSNNDSLIITDTKTGSTNITGETESSMEIDDMPQVLSASSVSIETVPKNSSDNIIPNSVLNEYSGQNTNLVKSEYDVPEAQNYMCNQNNQEYVSTLEANKSETVITTIKYELEKKEVVSNDSDMVKNINESDQKTTNPITQKNIAPPSPPLRRYFPDLEKDQLCVSSIETMTLTDSSEIKEKEISNHGDHNNKKSTLVHQEVEIPDIISDYKPPLPPIASQQSPKAGIKKRLQSKSKSSQPFISRESYKDENVLKNLDRLRESYKEGDLNDFLDDLESTKIPNDVDEAFLSQLLLDIRHDVEETEEQTDEEIESICKNKDLSGIKSESIESNQSTPVSIDPVDVPPRSSSAASKFSKVKERILEMINIRKTKGKVYNQGNSLETTSLNNELKPSNEIAETDNVSEVEIKTQQNMPQASSRSVTPQSIRPETPDPKASHLQRPSTPKNEESMSYKITEFLKKGSPKNLRKKYKERKNRKSDPFTSESESEDPDGLKNNIQWTPPSSMNNDESSSDLKGSYRSLTGSQELKKEVSNNESSSNLKGSYRSLTGSQELKKEVRFDPMTVDNEKLAIKELKADSSPIIQNQNIIQFVDSVSPSNVTCVIIEAQNSDILDLEVEENSYETFIPIAVEEINENGNENSTTLQEGVRPPRKYKNLIPKTIDDFNSDENALQHHKTTSSHTSNGTTKDESPPPLPSFENLTQICQPEFVIEDKAHNIFDYPEQGTNNLENTMGKHSSLDEFDSDPPSSQESNASIAAVLSPGAYQQMSLTLDPQGNDSDYHVPVTMPQIVMMYPPRTLPLPVIQESLNEDQISPTSSNAQITTFVTTDKPLTSFTEELTPSFPVVEEHNPSFYDNVNPFKEEMLLQEETSFEELVEMQNNQEIDKCIKIRKEVVSSEKNTIIKNQEIDDCINIKKEILSSENNTIRKNREINDCINIKNKIVSSENNANRKDDLSRNHKEIIDSVYNDKKTNILHLGIQPVKEVIPGEAFVQSPLFENDATCLDLDAIMEEMTRVANAMDASLDNRNSLISSVDEKSTETKVEDIQRDTLCLPLNMGTLPVSLKYSNVNNPAEYKGTIQQATPIAPVRTTASQTTSTNSIPAVKPPYPQQNRNPAQYQPPPCTYEAYSQTDTEYEETDLETESEFEIGGSRECLFRPRRQIPQPPVRDANALGIYHSTVPVMLQQQGIPLPGMTNLYQNQQPLEQIETKSDHETVKPDAPPRALVPRQRHNQMPMNLVSELKSVLSDNEDGVRHLKKVGQQQQQQHWDTNINWHTDNLEATSEDEWHEFLDRCNLATNLEERQITTIRPANCITRAAVTPPTQLERYYYDDDDLDMYYRASDRACPPEVGEWLLQGGRGRGSAGAGPSDRWQYPSQVVSQAKSGALVSLALALPGSPEPSAAMGSHTSNIPHDGPYQSDQFGSVQSDHQQPQTGDLVQAVSNQPQTGDQDQAGGYTKPPEEGSGTTLDCSRNTTTPVKNSEPKSQVTNETNVQTSEKGLIDNENDIHNDGINISVTENSEVIHNFEKQINVLDVAINECEFIINTSNISKNINQITDSVENTSIISNSNDQNKSESTPLNNNNNNENNIESKQNENISKQGNTPECLEQITPLIKFIELIDLAPSESKVKINENHANQVVEKYSKESALEHTQSICDQSGNLIYREIIEEPEILEVDSVNEKEPSNKLETIKLRANVYQSFPSSGGEDDHQKKETCKVPDREIPGLIVKDHQKKETCKVPDREIPGINVKQQQDNNVADTSKIRANVYHSFPSLPLQHKIPKGKPPLPRRLSVDSAEEGYMSDPGCRRQGGAKVKVIQNPNVKASSQPPAASVEHDDRGYATDSEVIVMHNNKALRDALLPVAQTVPQLPDIATVHMQTPSAVTQIPPIKETSDDDVTPTNSEPTTPVPNTDLSGFPILCVQASVPQMSIFDMEFPMNMSSTTSSHKSTGKDFFSHPFAAFEDLIEVQEAPPPPRPPPPSDEHEDDDVFLPGNLVSTAHDLHYAATSVTPDTYLYDSSASVTSCWRPTLASVTAIYAKPSNTNDPSVSSSYGSRKMPTVITNTTDAKPTYGGLQVPPPLPPPPTHGVALRRGKTPYLKDLQASGTDSETNDRLEAAFCVARDRESDRASRLEQAHQNYMQRERGTSPTSSADDDYLSVTAEELAHISPLTSALTSPHLRSNEYVTHSSSPRASVISGRDGHHTKAFIPPPPPLPPPPPHLNSAVCSPWHPSSPSADPGEVPARTASARLSAEVTQPVTAAPPRQYYHQTPTVLHPTEASVSRTGGPHPGLYTDSQLARRPHTWYLDPPDIPPGQQSPVAHPKDRDPVYQSATSRRNNLTDQSEPTNSVPRRQQRSASLAPSATPSSRPSSQVGPYGAERLQAQGLGEWLFFARLDRTNKLLSQLPSTMVLKPTISGPHSGPILGNIPNNQQNGHAENGHETFIGADKYYPGSVDHTRSESPQPPPRPKTPPLDERDPEQVAAERRYLQYFQYQGPPSRKINPTDQPEPTKISLAQQEAQRRYENHFIAAPPRASNYDLPPQMSDDEIQAAERRYKSYFKPSIPRTKVEEPPERPPEPDYEQLEAERRYQAHFQSTIPRSTRSIREPERTPEPDYEQLEAERRYQSYFNPGPPRRRSESRYESETTSEPDYEQLEAEKRYMSHFNSGPPKRHQSSYSSDTTTPEPDLEQIEAERRYLSYFHPGPPRPRPPSEMSIKSPEPDSQQIEAEKRYNSYFKGTPKSKHPKKDKEEEVPQRPIITPEMLEAEKRLMSYYKKVPCGRPKHTIKVEPPMSDAEAKRKQLMKEYWVALENKTERKSQLKVKISKPKNERIREKTPPSIRELVQKEFLEVVQIRKKEKDLHFGDTDDEDEEEENNRQEELRKLQRQVTEPTTPTIEGGGEVGESLLKDLDLFVSPNVEITGYQPSSVWLELEK